MKSLFAILCMFVSPLWASDVDQLQKALSGLQTMQAQFEQTIFSDRFGDENAKGKVRILRPRQMVWIYEDPALRLFLADGQTFYRYDAQEDIEHQSKQDELMEQPTSFFFLWEDIELVKHYTIEVIKEPKNQYQFEMIPLSKDADMKSISLTASFDPFIIHRIETTDTLDQKNELRFSKVLINQKLDQQAFDYKVLKDKLNQKG